MSDTNSSENLHGKKCNIIFIRKVRKRLEELEEKYKDLPSRDRKTKINEGLLYDFCVDERQVRNWKKIAETSENLRENKNETENVFLFEALAPSATLQISRVPEEKQRDVAKKIIEQKLTVRQAKVLVDKELEIKKVPKGPYVSKSGVEWTDYGLNIYFGCSHDCDYCYAKRMNDKTRWVEKWTEPIKRDINLEELSEELDQLQPGTLFFCPITDAYQPLNRKLNWANQVLKVLLSKRHITTLILTKSSDVEKDFDEIFYAHNTLHNVKLGFTITSLDDEASKKYEPCASPPSERIRVLELAHRTDIPTFVSIEPWILGLTEPVEIIRKLNDYTDEWIIGVQNYSETKLTDYQPFIGNLHSFLIKNNIRYRMKAELDRAFKSNPVLSKEQYAEAESKMVGR